MLTKETIQATRRREWVPIEAWTPEGETFDSTQHGVWVGPLGARAALAYEDEIQTQIGDAGKVEDHAALFALIAVYSVQREDGSLLFTREDAGWLANMSLNALLPIFQTAMRLSNMTPNAHEEAAKNSAPGDGSSSASS